MTATLATIHLHRFGSEVALDEAKVTPPQGSRFCFTGIDEPMTPRGLARRGAVWAVVALFDDRAAALTALATQHLEAASPPDESWSAVLAPIHHRGELNWLDRASPGSVLAPQPAEPGTGPVAVLTSVGFDFAVPGFDMARPVRFGLDVNAQRETMAATPGLKLQTAFYADEPTTDAITFSVWEDERAIGRFAYAPGPHRTQIDRFNAEGLADRSSFTRFRILAARGSWGGAALI